MRDGTQEGLQNSKLEMKKRRGLKGCTGYLQTLNVLQEDVTNSLIISFNVRVGTALPEIGDEIGSLFHVQ